MRTITNCVYGAICRKQYGRFRDSVEKGCLLGKVLEQSSAFMSLYVKSADGTTFCAVTEQSSLLEWRTVQPYLFRATKTEFSVRIRTWLNLAYFNARMQSPMFGWITVPAFFFSLIM